MTQRAPFAVQILQKCIGALEQEDVKAKLYELIQPTADQLYHKIMPYGLSVGIIILVSFLLQVATFLCVYRIRKTGFVQNKI